MIEILSFVQKKCDGVELAKPLRQYINKTYGEHEAKSYEGALNTANQMRNEIRNLQDRAESSRDSLFRYYSQLQHLKSHFPISDGSGRIKISFTWFDAFTRRKLSQSNIAYEQACVLFNAGLICIQLGAAESRKTDEGIKSAAKHFTTAAGIFQHIKEDILPSIAEKITTDISKESLDCMSDIALAHAQMCIYEKAVMGKMTHSATSKLAREASCMYASILKQMTSAPLNEQFEKAWPNFLKFCSLVMDANANYHVAQELHANDSIGEELARLEKTLALLKEAASTQKSLPPSFTDYLNNLLARVRKSHETAVKENEKIYHERVPNPETLPLIERKKLVKASELPDFSNLVSNAFAKLIPVQILEYKSQYSDKVAQKLQQAAHQAREHREKIKAMLAQMNLPGSILAVEKVEGLPEPVHEKVNRVKEEGGMARIHELLQTLTELSEETGSLGNEITEIINDEETDDRQCREQFGTRWGRLPSEKLTANLKKQLGEYKEKTRIASKSDAVIQNKLAENRENLEKLGFSRQELDSLLPRDDTNDISSDFGKSYQELKQLLPEIDKHDIHIQDIVEKRLKSLQEQDNIDQILLNALSQNQNLDVVINEEQGKFEPLIQQIAQIQAQQDDIMNKIQAANAIFVQKKEQNATVLKREHTIQSVISGVNKFEEILGNVKEGIQFYSNMQELLRKFKQRVEDFVFARRTEKADIISNLQLRLAGMTLDQINPNANIQQQGPPPEFQQPTQQQPQQPTQQQKAHPQQQQQQHPQQRPHVGSSNAPQQQHPQYNQPQYGAPNTQPQYSQGVYGSQPYNQPPQYAPQYGQQQGVYAPPQYGYAPQGQQQQPPPYQQYPPYGYVPYGQQPPQQYQYQQQPPQQQPPRK